jgi:hypothetical protein
LKKELHISWHLTGIEKKIAQCIQSHTEEGIELSQVKHSTDTITKHLSEYEAVHSEC